MSNNLLLQYDSEIAKGDNYFYDSKFQEAESCFQAALYSLSRYQGYTSYPFMLENKLKDKIQLCRWSIRDAQELNTHLGCVLYHLQRFDIKMVADLLQDDLTYMDCTKDVFIEQLSSVLKYFEEDGDTYLNRIPGYCDSKDCNYMKAGFSFVGNKSKQYMDLIFEIENDLIADICECTEFKCSEMSFDGRFKITVDKNNLPF